jgi:hypothetical protein
VTFRFYCYGFFFWKKESPIMMSLKKTKTCAYEDDRKQKEKTNEIYLGRDIYWKEEEVCL